MEIKENGKESVYGNQPMPLACVIQAWTEAKFEPRVQWLPEKAADNILKWPSYDIIIVDEFGSNK